MLLLCSLLSAQVDKSYFDVYYSTYQSWCGGAYGSGSGTNYTFCVRFKKDVEICLDTVWFVDDPRYLTCNKYVGSVKEIKYMDLIWVQKKKSFRKIHALMSNVPHSFSFM